MQPRNESWSARWLISGRVQGVGYRYFAYDEAQRLGIAVWARNLPDGRVEVVARGSSEKLMTFERALARGPSFASVENVEREDNPDDLTNLNLFDIK